MKRYALVFCACLLFLCGCSVQKSLFVLMPDPDGKVGEITVKNPGGQRTLTRPQESTEVWQTDTPPSKPQIMSQKQIQAVFRDALAAQPLLPVRFILYFKTGTADLTKESKTQLPEAFAVLSQRPHSEFSVIGHTDTQGPHPMNYQLGLKRASMVRDMLVSQGVAPGRIKVTSHGEIDLLVPTGDEVDEPRNRRVEVFVR